MERTSDYFIKFIHVVPESFNIGEIHYKKYGNDSNDCSTITLSQQSGWGLKCS